MGSKPTSEKKPNKGVGGRPRWQPTDEVRHIVKGMAIAGIQREVIAQCLGVDVKTLRDRCKKELEESSHMAVAKVAAALYNAAVVDGSVPAMIFFLKCRGRWSEPRPEEQDKPQQPIPIVNVTLSGIKADANNT